MLHLLQEVFSLSSLWPKVVQERIRSTYGYFAGSLFITAASAYGIARSRFIHRWMAASPLLVRLAIEQSTQSL